jgi:putative DNA primase/helicase
MASRHPVAQSDRAASLAQCKASLPMPALWQRLGLAGEPKRSMHSPFREDARESFSVFQHEGKWFFKDFVDSDIKGDEVDLIRVARNSDVREAIRVYHELAGIDPQDFRGKSPRPGLQKQPRKLGKITHVYDYLDESGKLAHQTLRYDPKDFRQRRPVREGEESVDGFVWSLQGTRTVLYNLPQVLGTDAKTPVFFVEGEKDAENLRQLGLVATTTPMGANKWRDEYTEMLRGKFVCLIGDNDGGKQKHAGQKHVAMVAEKLGHAPSRLGVINLAGMWPRCPVKGDVSNWIEAQEDGSDILAGTLTRWALETKDEREWLGCVVPGDRGPRLVHIAIARAMVSTSQIRYVGEWWWQWNHAGVWEPMPVQRTVRKELADRVEKLPDGRELVTAASVNAIEDLMASLTAMHPDGFNQHDRELINCGSGMLRLNPEKRELLPHDPSYFSTVQIPWKYNPDSGCSTWNHWLEERIPDQDVRDLVQEIFGYCLTDRVNFHRFFFFYGDGGTGKSTTVNMLTRLIGEKNMVSVQMQELDNPFTRAQLVGKRLYCVKELTRDSLKHIGLVKAITSGDPINVERKHKDGFSYRPTGRFIMESNIRANTPDSSDGFMRRFCQVTFSKQIPRSQFDFSLEDKLALEMEGIFIWALQGLERLLARGRFAETADSRQAAQELEMHRMSVKAFFECCVEIVDDKSKMLSATALMTSYHDWCEWQHVKPHYEESAQFSRELVNRIPELKDRKSRERSAEGRMMFYTGLRFRDWKESLGVVETVA